MARSLSLRRRIGLALAATAAGSVAITAILSAGLLRREAERDAREDLRRLARALAAEPGDIASGERLGLRALERVLAINGDRFAVVAPNGALRGTAAGLAAQIDPAPLLAGGRIEGTAGGFVYVGVPVLLKRQQVARGVVLARPVANTRETLAGVIPRVALAAVAAVLAAFAVSALLVRRLVRPLQHLSRAAARVARGDLTHRVAVESEDEVGDLARTFNEMSDALAESQRREREFLASVSHELKTPLTAIRGYAEALGEGAVRGGAARGEAIRIIRAETDRLDRMVQDVMDLARLGAREFRLDVRPVDLAETLREGVSAHRAQAAEAGIELVAELPERLPVQTDPDRIRQVVSNLVENALRVTDAGGTVRVGARAEDARAVIEVTDTGPGIPTDDLPHVFERSYLWRASRGMRPVGTGLGLAIVRELVDVLRGTLEVRSEIGYGTTFRVLLPARAGEGGPPGA